MKTSRPFAAAAATVLLLAGCSDDTTPSVEAELGASVSDVESVSEEPSSEEDAASTDGSAEESDGEAAVDPSQTETEVGATDDGDCTVSDDESAIEVLSPTAGETVTAPFTLEVCGNTFEATFVYELELADGTIAVAGFGTMDCGDGCVGTGTEQVGAEGTGAATLRVFEDDAASGGRVNVVEVPVELAG